MSVKPSSGRIPLRLPTDSSLLQEEELRLLESVVVHSHDAVFIADFRGAGQREVRLVYVNDAVTRITGYDRDELLGRCPRILRGNRPDYDGRIDDIFAAVQAGRPVSSRLELLRKNGSSFWGEFDIVPVYRDGGKAVSHYVCFLRDVTEQRETRLALERSEARFRSMVANISEVFTMIDADRRIVYQSPSVRKVLGFAPEEMTGFAVTDYIHPDDHGLANEALRAVAEKEGASVSATVRARTLHGTYRWVEAVATNLLTDPQLASIVLNWRDVTETRALQQQLLLSDRLASLGTLSAGVAHEINNPLAYITLNIEYVARQLALREAARAESASQGQLAELTDALREANEGAERVRRIVQDLRVFARGESPAHAVRLDLNGVVESSLNLVWNEIRHRARLVRELGPVPGVRADASRLAQVLVNLLLNAAQAIPEGRVDQNEIRVCTRSDSRGWAVIAVSDTGAGIGSEERKQIFDPFFTTKPVGLGTGLGLSIVHGIVRAAGGEVRVDSEVGKGSTFTVKLPPAEAAGTGGDVETSAQPPARRVLIIDDEALVARSLLRSLGDEYEVFSAASADEALEMLARDNRFDLLLCDVLMPQKSGMEFRRALAERYPGLLPRLVFMTGGAFTPESRSFLRETSHRVLEKPFDSAEVRRLLFDQSR